MSYILQALARSERERKQLEARDLGEALEVVPAAADSGRAPGRTVVALSVALTAVAVGLTLLAIDHGGGSTTAPATPAAGEATTRSAMSAGPGSSTAPDSTAEQTSTPPPDSRPAAAGRQVAATSLRQAAVSPPASSDEATGQVISAPATAEPRKAPELERVQSLPGIDVTIHVYSEDPRRRFVYINGQRYGEGERIEGLTASVRGITREGLVVDLGNRLALLEVRQ